MKNELRNNLIKTTKELIRFKTTRDNYHARVAIINYVAEQFQDYPVCIKKYENAKCPSIVVLPRGIKNPEIIMNGHLDVVFGDEKDFHPKVIAGKIFGRGSGDMKAACAVMIETMKYYSLQKKQPSLGLMLTTDEEVGGKNGVGFLVKNKKYKPKIVIIPDGGIDLRTIVVSQKGILHLLVRAHGESAHGARPFLGENAIDKLISIYSGIRKAIPEILKQEWKNTMNIGVINGGEATNKVPHYAEMRLDIRYINYSDKKNILDKIKKITNDFEIISEGQPFLQAVSDKMLKQYIKIAEQVLREKIRFYKVEGASDARYFSEIGIPAIITKINCANIHANNEWVEIAEMEKLYSILLKFIKNYS